MIGLAAVVVVAIFAIVFGGIAVMQELQDRRRERDEISSVVRELREYHQRQKYLRLEKEQDRRDEEMFEEATPYVERADAARSQERQGHRGFSERRTAA